MIPPDLLDAATRTLATFRTRGWTLATAESCTGGLISGALTEIPGSSDVVECGFVTYANAAKIRMLGVDPALLAAHGAVSEPVAAAMASGALAHSTADAAVAVTGVAGPGGGTVAKPVGTVWFGVAARGGTVRTARHVFPGDRSAVRAATVVFALALLDGVAGEPA